MRECYHSTHVDTAKFACRVRAWEAIATAFRLLSFDCYGTLVDWETGLLAQLRPWAERNGLAVADDDLLAAFATAEAVTEAEFPSLPYTEILRRVHRHIAGRFERESSRDDAAAFSHSVGDWPVFSDTVAALRELKTSYKLVILSNTDRASFARTKTKLGVEFDALVLAEDVGAYKPDRRMFDAMLVTAARFDIAPHEILHVAESLYHDHVPAKALGLATAWIHRRHAHAGSGATAPTTAVVQPDFYARSLRELVLLCGMQPRG